MGGGQYRESYETVTQGSSTELLRVLDGLLRDSLLRMCVIRLSGFLLGDFPLRA